MILWVKDGNGVNQQVCVQSPTDTITDSSGTLTATGDSEILLDPVPEGFVRAGWFFQNNGDSGAEMLINEIGGEAQEGPSVFHVVHGATFPPPGYPVPQGQISVSGVQGDSYACRQWVTPVPVL